MRGSRIFLTFLGFFFLEPFATLEQHLDEWATNCNHAYAEWSESVDFLSKIICNYDAKQETPRRVQEILHRSTKPRLRVAPCDGLGNGSKLRYIRLRL